MTSSSHEILLLMMKVPSLSPIIRHPGRDPETQTPLLISKCRDVGIYFSLRSPPGTESGSLIWEVMIADLFYLRPHSGVRMPLLILGFWDFGVRGTRMTRIVGINSSFAHWQG